MTKKQLLGFNDKRYVVDTLLLHAKSAPVIEVSRDQLAKPEGQFRVTLLPKVDERKDKLVLLYKHGDRFIVLYGEELIPQEAAKIKARLVNKHCLKHAEFVNPSEIEAAERRFHESLGEDQGGFDRDARHGGRSYGERRPQQYAGNRR
jgi:hypothetical protein